MIVRIPKLSDVAAMAECRKVGRVLQSYLDGQVDELTMQRVSRHLDACRRCGLEAHVYDELKQALARGATHIDPAAVERASSFGRVLLETPPGQAADPASG